VDGDPGAVLRGHADIIMSNAGKYGLEALDFYLFPFNDIISDEEQR
jgi:hypothetical protein